MTEIQNPTLTQIFFTESASLIKNQVMIETIVILATDDISFSSMNVNKITQVIIMIQIIIINLDVYTLIVKTYKL
jgi:hypothetical protein